MNHKSLRLLIAGGGTGGHVFPAIAVADELRRTAPASELLFVGSTRGLEKTLVEKAGYDIELLKVGRLHGTGMFGRLKTLAGLPAGLYRALRILRKFAPQVVVGVGGYASGPIAVAAWLCRIPLVLLEQNAAAGSTNRILARFAKKVVTSFPETIGVDAQKAMFLGNPLRQSLLESVGQRAYQPGGGSERTLLVMGGSQGARRINELMIEIAPALAERLPRLSVIHQTGQADFENVQQAYAACGLEAEVAPFFDDMAGLYQRADLAFCRSGATSCAELAACGLPALFIPYPFASHDHQALNTEAMVKNGAALMVRQDKLDADLLLAEFSHLLADGGPLLSMSSKMSALGRPQAAREVVSLLRELALP